jgi:MFS family permease
VGQAIVVRCAPEEMRGRYLAVYGFGWVIPMAVGPLLAGLVMDNIDPRWVWYGAGIVGLVAAGAFALQDQSMGRSTWAAVDRRLDVIQRLEEGEISASEAAGLLQGVDRGVWSTLAGSGSGAERRHLRFRVSDQGSGAIKFDMSLPVSLVNTAIYLEGRLAAELEGIDPQELRALIASAAGRGAATMETADNQRVEVLLDE